MTLKPAVIAELIAESQGQSLDKLPREQAAQIERAAEVVFAEFISCEPRYAAKRFEPFMAVADVESLAKLIHESEQATQLAFRVVAERSEESLKNMIQETFLRGAEKKDFHRSAQAYRDETAVLLDAALSSPHFKTSVIEGDWEELGPLVKTASYEPNTFEWLKNRLFTVGGSDIGRLVSYDANPSAPSVLRALEASKTLTDEQIESKVLINNRSTRGPLYRGTVWEPYIRHGFAKDHPELKVYNLKSQYCDPNAPWKTINVDGIYRGEDGVRGILEIKTSMDAEKWSDGPPLEYRAQGLYYLHVTGFEECTFRVLVADSIIHDFVIRHDDPISASDNRTMDQYVLERVEPWFLGLMEEREHGSSE